MYFSLFPQEDSLQIWGQTEKNIKANEGKIAISAYDTKSLEGYQIKGTAEYVTEGAIVAAFKTAVEGMFKGVATAKGALIITPSKVIVTRSHIAFFNTLITDSFNIEYPFLVKINNKKQTNYSVFIENAQGNSGI